jgi:hypothetical protein
MLSKAEVLYLHGQKQVSKSYERKLKCIIRKKLEILQTEFPLLSKLFVNEVRPLLDTQIPTESMPVKEEYERLQSSSQQSAVDNSVTIFGNSKLNNVEQVGSEKLVAREGLEGSKTLNPALSEATEFSNGKTRNATDFGNFIKKTAPGEGL